MKRILRGQNSTTVCLCAIVSLSFAPERADAQTLVEADSLYPWLRVPSSVFGSEKIAGSTALVEPARLGIPHAPSPPGFAAVPVSPSRIAQRSRSKYVVAGALAGVTLYGVGLAIYFSQSSSEFLGNPAALLLPAIGAAGIGAFARWLVYEARER